MKDTKETLFELVRSEADNLKKMATKDELGRLDFSTLVPLLQKKSIYGQMTGTCFSFRAGELIKWCAERIYLAYSKAEMSPLSSAPQGIRCMVSTVEFPHYSPIEVMTSRYPENNKNLVGFLKGENKLDLK